MNINELENQIDYVFSNKRLVERAMRHSSFANENPDPPLEDNERLEFLGDSVLSLCVSHLLMTYYPELDEGDLSKIRAGLVNDQSLAYRSRLLSLGAFIQLGKGEEQSLGREKDSILAGTFEALLGAIYLDSGLQPALDLTTRCFHKDMKAPNISEISRDYKSTLQEYTQAEYKTSPVYELIEAIGPDHDKSFRYRVAVGDVSAEGSGSSKQAAQQMAAQKALQMIQSSVKDE